MARPTDIARPPLIVSALKSMAAAPAGFDEGDNPPLNSPA
jgi:hypothetical protein